MIEYFWGAVCGIVGILIGQAYVKWAKYDEPVQVAQEPNETPNQ